MSFSPPLRGINLKLPNNINWIWIKAKVHARNIFILNATWSQHCITSTASWFRFSSENRNMMCLIDHVRVTPASVFSYSQGNETHFMIT